MKRTLASNWKILTGGGLVGVAMNVPYAWALPMAIAALILILWEMHPLVRIKIGPFGWGGYRGE